VTFQWFAARKSFPPVRAANQLLPGARERRRRRSAAQSLADDPSPTSSPCVSGDDIADFSFASSDFKTLGAFFCNFLQLCHSCGVAHGQPRARLLHLVGSRLPSPYHFRARIQSFQPVAAPFPGDSVFAVRPSRAALPAPKRLCSKTDDRPGDLRRADAVRTNIEQLRNSGKKFVERHDQGHGMFLIASVAASRSSAGSEGEAMSTRYVSALNDIADAPRRAILRSVQRLTFAEWGNFAKRRQTSILSTSSSVTSSARRSPVSAEGHCAGRRVSVKGRFWRVLRPQSKAEFWRFPRCYKTCTSKDLLPVPVLQQTGTAERATFVTILP
jgi:hypothetical protein